MWKGLATNELYEKFLQKGLCAEHSKEFILAATDEAIGELRTELQRKALLFIRLRMFDPIVFSRPCVSSKLMDLLSREDAAPKRGSESLDVFVEKFTLFDSVVVFIVCYFSRICCIGALFLRKTKIEVNHDPLIGTLQNVLEKKHLLENEINVLFPILQRNFNDYDPDQIRLAYVATLLFVRNYVKRKPLKAVTEVLAAELKMSTECQELNLQGNEAYKKEQLEQAIELFSLAISKKPYSYMILSNRSQAYKKLKKFKEAQLDAYIVVAINPTWCLGYHKLAGCLYHQGFYDQAFHVAECGLSKCKKAQSKDYENLQTLKMEASFRKPSAGTKKENACKSITPENGCIPKTPPSVMPLDERELDEGNAQSHSASNQKEIGKETEKPEQLRLGIDSSTPKKADELAKDPVEKVKGCGPKIPPLVMPLDERELDEGNVQSHSASNLKEIGKETEESEQLRLGINSSTSKKADELAKDPVEKVKVEIDSSTPKKADEIQTIPNEKVKKESDHSPNKLADGEESKKTDESTEKKKAISPSKGSLTQLSPQKDVPPLLEAPESDDSYSEAAPPLMEAPESEESDSEAAPPLMEAPESEESDSEAAPPLMEAPESEESDSEEVPPLLDAPSESDDSYYEDGYYEDEDGIESPPYEETEEKSPLDCNAGQQKQKENLEQNVEKDEAEFDTPPNKEISQKSTFYCSVDQEQKSNLEQNLKKLKPDTTSKPSGINYEEFRDQVCGNLNELMVKVEKRISLLTESLSSKATHIDSAVTIKPTDKGTEGEKPKDVNSTEKELAVNNNIKGVIRTTILVSKDNLNTVLDVRDKSNKKSDKKLKTVQAQNLTSVKKKPKCPSSVDNNEESKLDKVHSLLKEGSEVLANGCGYLACRYFQEALSLIKESPQIYGFQECDIVCIKYAYAKALHLSGEYSDLRKCIDILHEIRQEHENVTFPTVYYGLALAFLKLNRFKDSLSYSKKVEEFLQKGFRLKVYPWPGLTQPIPETKAEILKNYIKDLIEECENPPKPCAICRYEICPQPHIYYSDPDFKGFICIFCSEQCFLQYHVTCWRSMKTDLSLSDKDFLNKNCLTPDCDGSIVEVKNIDKQGNIGKVFASSEIKKPQKVKKSKLEKKSDAKEERKKKRRHSSSRCDSISSASEAPSHDDLNPSSSSSKLSQNETESEVSSSVHIEDLENPEAVSISSTSMSEDVTCAKTRKASFLATEKNGDVLQKFPSVVNDLKTAKIATVNEPNTETEGNSTKALSSFLIPKSTFSADADSLNEAKADSPPGNSKNAEIMITKSRPVIKFKGKSLKCTAAETSNETNTYVPTERIAHISNKMHPLVSNDTSSRVQCSDVFWSAHEAEDFPPLPGSDNSSHYAVECQNSNKDVSEPPDIYLNTMLEKNILRYLEEFLSFHGPLKIDDPILIEALSEFPTEANVLIADCGGISEFLKNDIHFAVVGEAYICVVKDISSAYNLASHRSLAHETDCHDLLNSVCDFSNAAAVKSSNFPTYLNPDAMEYKPFFSTGTEYDSHGQKDSHKMSEHNSDSLISVVSRLRQPLCVDEDNIVKSSSCDNVSKLDTQSLNLEISNAADVATRTHLGKELFSCDNDNVIASYVDIVGEEEAVSKGTLGENISVEAVEEENSGEISKDRVSKGTVKKILSDRTGEENISKENVLGRIFKVDEEIFSEGKVKQKICDEMMQVNNTKKSVQKKSREETIKEKKIPVMVQKKDLEEVVAQRILEQDKNFEGTVQESISDETITESRAARMLSERIVKKTINNLAVKDIALKNALSEALSNALTKTFLRAEDKEMAMQNEVGNFCVEGMENKAPCKTMKVSLQNQNVVKNQNCGHIVPDTSTKASQTENAQKSTMVSKATMKTDESSERVKEIVGYLQDKERVSLEKYKLLEIKFKACMEENANIKSRNECAEKELNACKVASEELSEKVAENEKLRNEVDSFQIALKKAQEQNEISQREVEIFLLRLGELKKNQVDFKSWQANLEKYVLDGNKDYKRVCEELLETEEKCRKAQTEADERFKQLTEKLTESEEKYKKSNEEVQILKKKERSLRNESQAAFEHLNELVASLTNEKLESIKRAVKAELTVLQVKKAEVLNKIDLKITEANQKVKELKEGISLIPLDPVNTKNIEALMSQIENKYVKELCAIRSDYEAKIDKNIKEVESGTPLEKLKIGEVKKLPEIPQVIVPSPAFNPTPTYPAASVSVDPSFVNMASAFPPLAMPSALHPIGTANAVPNVPIAPIVSKNITAAVPEPAAAPAPTLKKLPPGISGSLVNLPKSTPSCSSVKETGHELNSLAQLSEMSKKENSKTKIISSDSLSSSSSGNEKAAAKFPESSIELGYSLKGNSAAKGISVPQGKNSYEKLLNRLVEKFPNYTQVQLMSFIREFREKRQGKLSGLTLDAIVTQVGALIQSKQSATKNESSKVNEVPPRFRTAQNKVPGKKLITELKTKEPPAEVPSVKKGNPWGNSASDGSKKWSGWLEECAICCEEFANEKAAYKVDCGHCFHLECIREWLNKKSDCPICRVHLLLPEDYPSLS